VALSLAEPADLSQQLSAVWQDPLRRGLPGAGREDTRATPGHNRWHADIPVVAEVISGGSVRLECERPVSDEAEPLLCGPVAIVGAEPGDLIVVDILGVGRHDGRFPAFGHPGVIGCAPAAPAAAGAAAAPDAPAAAGAPGAPGAAVASGPAAAEPEGVLLGHLRPGVPAYDVVAAQALRSAQRSRDIGCCAAARLTAGSRILFPVAAHRAKLSVGDLHFPASRDALCAGTGQGGWIDLRIHLTKRGVERFHVAGPLLMSDRGISGALIP
jgi:formamidase